MPRHRTYDEDSVLDRAMDLFWRQGYQRTSVQDLVDATGINRASMYAAFGSKAGFFSAALERYLAGGALADVLREDRETPLIPLLEAVFDELIELAVADGERRGCLLTNTVVELTPHDDEVGTRIRRELLKLEEALADSIERAQGRGEVPLDEDPISLARVVLNTIQGLRVLSKVNPDRELLSDIAWTTLRRLRN